MAGDIRTQVPGNMQLPVRIGGVLSIKEVARIIAPVLGTFAALHIIALLELYPVPLFIQLAAFGVAGVAGAGLALIKPKGNTIDTHLVNAVSWKLLGQHIPSPVRDVTEDYVKTPSGLTAVLQVSTTNLSLKTQLQQRALHSRLADLYTGVDYPITLRSEQRRINLEPYLEHLTDRVPGDSLDELRYAYLNELAVLNSGDITVTDHYITVTANTETELNRRVTRILNAMRGDVTTRRLVGPDLERYAERHDHAAEPAIDHVKADDTAGYDYQRTLIITEQPADPFLAWTVEPLQVQGLVDVTQHISPKNHRKTTNTLNRRITHLKAEIISTQMSGRNDTHRYEARIRDAEWMLEQLAENREKPVTQLVAITVHDDSLEAVNRTMEDVKTQLDTDQIQYVEPFLQQPAAYKTGRSFQYNPQTFNDLLMPASSAAAAFPFATTDAIQLGGMLYGEHREERTPVILNRFNWSAGHAVVVGETGSGKTFFQSLEIIRSLLTYPDLQVYILDPKQDYGDLVEALGGKKLAVTPDVKVPPDTRLVSFTIEDRGSPRKQKDLAAVLGKLYTAISNSQRRTLLVVDEAHNLLNSDQGRTVLTQLVREARDTNTAMSMLSQSANDFAKTEDGRVILDNTTAKVFFRHERIGDNMIDYFQLSDKEAEALLKLEKPADKDTGLQLYSEAIIRVSGYVKARIKVKPSMVEKRLIERYS